MVRSRQGAFVTAAMVVTTAVRTCAQVVAEMVCANVENVFVILDGRELNVKLRKCAQEPPRRGPALGTVFASTENASVTSVTRGKVVKYLANAPIIATEMVSAGRESASAVQGGLVKPVASFQTRIRNARARPRKDPALEMVFAMTAAVYVPHNLLEKIALLRKSVPMIAVGTESAS